MRMTTDTDPRAATAYAQIAEAIAYVVARYPAQPPLAEIAAHIGLSPTHCQRLFTRWAGISPKRLLGAMAADHARTLLRQSRSVLDTAYEVGLSGPGRLHDLLITHEAMSPGAFKAYGRDVEIGWGWHPSPFGACLVLETGRGICGLAFAEDGAKPAVAADMFARWPDAHFVHRPERAAQRVQQIFAPPGSPSVATPLPLLLIGSNFQIKVWEALMRIPPGHTVSYQDLARFIGKPGAVRAVGSANGRNPISYLIPCHRVLRKSGALGGYHWGVARKQAMLAVECARYRDQPSEKPSTSAIE